eukprot:4338949-Ditylum_brightwellii.AAC.1
MDVAVKLSAWRGCESFNEFVWDLFVFATSSFKLLNTVDDAVAESCYIELELLELDRKVVKLLKFVTDDGFGTSG